MQDLFLPYQKHYLSDNSRFKLVKKSRRTGFTWVQAFEDVKDAASVKIKNKPLSVWFSSADASAAKEYILYCADWAKYLNLAFEDTGEIFIDEDKDIKALSLIFKNGGRINALSSNPAGFRSKGGKVVIDEFAFHKNGVELWKAAKPVITWGFPLRIISTLNGTNNLFYRFTEEIKKGKLNWSMHEVDIFKAVNEGLADKIMGRKLTPAERLKWIEDERGSTGDEITWKQEYCCIAVDEASAFITYELINSCVGDTLNEELEGVQGELYVGYDVARVHDLSAVYMLEKTGSVFYLRKKFEFKNVSFREQKEAVKLLLNHPKTRHIAIDNTGIGRQMAEELQEEYGRRMVTPVTFTPKVKEELAYRLLYAFQDRNIRIPNDEALKNDIHSVKRLPTEISGAIKFDVSKTETDGHADRFWALALAVFAGTSEPYQTPVIRSFGRRKTITSDFEFDQGFLNKFKI